MRLQRNTQGEPCACQVSNGIALKKVFPEIIVAIGVMAELLTEAKPTETNVKLETNGARAGDIDDFRRMRDNEATVGLQANEIGVRVRIIG